MDLDAHGLRQRAKTIVGESRAHFVDATGLGVALLGDTIAANMFMVGYATQLGLLPVSVAAIEKAIELNAVAVSLNLRAFQLGRLWVHQPDSLRAALSEPPAASDTRKAESVEEVLAYRTELLTSYQDTRYADRYRVLVQKVAEAEAALGKEGLVLAVARNFARLMAYKDEYEVARLYADSAFSQKLHAQFEGGFKLKFNLAPPLLAKKDAATGHLRKREYGAWILTVQKKRQLLKQFHQTVRRAECVEVKQVG